MYRLTKTFAEQPSPQRVANQFKMKIDKFKQHLALLHVVCNPGLRQRHWQQMEEVVGFELKPDDTTPFQTMVEYNLNKWIDKLEEIGAAAAKGIHFQIIFLDS